MIDVSSSVSDGGRAQTGLIGEDAAANALDESSLDAHTGQTTGNGSGIESTLDNGNKCSGNSSDIDDDNHQSSDDVDNSHHGNQQSADISQTLDTAQQDDAADNRADDGNHPGDDQLLRTGGGDKLRNSGIDGRSNGIDLGHVTDTEGRQCAEHCKDSAQPLPALAQTVLDVVHGAADPVASLVALTILDGQSNLSVLGTHTQQSGDPHPEDSTGTADGDSAGNAGDVTGTDGCCQSGTHGLEGRNGAFLLFGLFECLTQGILHNVDEVGELGEAAAYRQVDTDTQDQDHHGKTPDDAIDLTVQISDKLHKNPPYVFVHRSLKVSKLLCFLMI